MRLPPSGGVSTFAVAVAVHSEGGNGVVEVKGRGPLAMRLGALIGAKGSRHKARPEGPIDRRLVGRWVGRFGDANA